MKGNDLVLHENMFFLCFMALSPQQDDVARAKSFVCVLWWGELY
jgi:hypothetical protein